MQVMVPVHFYTDKAYSLLPKGVQKPSSPYQGCSATKRTLSPTGTCLSPGDTQSSHSQKGPFLSWHFPQIFLALVLSLPAHLLWETVLRTFLSVRPGEMVSVLMTPSSRPAGPEASLIPTANIVQYLPYWCPHKQVIEKYVYFPKKILNYVLAKSRVACKVRVVSY